MAISKSVLLIALICLAGLCALSYAQDVDHQQDNAAARKFSFEAFESADEVSDEEDQDEVPVADEEVRHFEFDFFEENEEDVDDSNADGVQVDLSTPARRFDFDQFEENAEDVDEDQDEDRKRNVVRDAAEDTPRRFSFDEFEENDEDVEEANGKPLQFDTFSDATAVSDTEAEQAQALGKRELPAQPAASPRSKFFFRKLW